jgi:hypothetical protein
METPQNAQVVAVWPDEKLEKEMLADAARLEEDPIWADHPPSQTELDAACHIKALLVRVRELERKIHDYEAGVTALCKMADTEEIGFVSLGLRIQELLSRKDHSCPTGPK